MTTRIDTVLTARRRQLGLRMYELALNAGVNPRTINNICNGHVPRGRTAARIETALGWEPGSLTALAAGGMPRVAEVADAPVPGVVENLFTEMGLADQSPRECIAHLAEEVGELAKATRTGNPVDVAEEIGDVGILLQRIAALYGIDVDQAIREKAASRLKRHHTE